ncbi:MAG: magnesium transporter, partial [Legionella longbeachae]|nr:magnesium transporter [Legionella longbeachae]
MSYTDLKTEGQGRMRLRTKQWSDRELKQWLSEAEISTVVDSINQGSTERQIQLFDLLSPTKAETVFIFLEPVNQAEILEHLDHKKALALLERMEPDDRARLFYELTEESSQRFLGLLSAKERIATALLLNYPSETAGRIMSPFFVALNPTMTVEEALDKIRTFGEEAETIYVMPVVGESMILKGTVELDKLVMTSPEKTIESLMTKNPKSFSVYADQEEIARFIQST